MDKIFIIAEAGVNHNGSTVLAKKLIDVAADAGADAVKFQTFRAENLVAAHAAKAEYQQQSTSGNESQLEMLKKLELGPAAHRELIDHCRERGIMFLSTPFDHIGIDLLHELGLEIFKIPSGEITNLPYLEKIGGLNKKVIMSTGMACIGEVESALNILIAAGTPKEKITLLHANTQYPTPVEDVNLAAMTTLAETFKIDVGYSDHTLGIEIPVAAAALGAKVIEKHFTLDRHLEGPDHQASLTPDELKAMVQAIRRVEKALGDGIKRPTRSETPNIQVARKSIVAGRNICKGEVFTADNLAVKRPGSGISPMRWHEILGRIANRDYQPDELI